MPPSSPRAPDASGANGVLLASVELAHEQDVVLARQRARKVAELLGFDFQDQVRIATATSEIAREGRHAGGRARLSLCADPDKGLLLVQLQQPAEPGWDRSGVEFRSREGIVAAQRILGPASVAPAEGSAVWTFVRALSGRKRWDAHSLSDLAGAIACAPAGSLLQEFQVQNEELLESLQESRRYQAELAQVNRELEETNRGVLALYAELEEQAQSLSRTNEQKTRFYSSISHEFRTPVTSILSLSQILLDRLDGELTAEQERQISLIRRCGQNLLEWVNDLLDLARADSGRMEVRPTTFSAYDLMTSLRGIMRPLAVNKDVKLVFEDGVDLQQVVLYSDEGKLSQVLRNLVSNALKFTERGEVRVSVDLSEPPAGSVGFVVRDTGIGIASQDLQRIFDEFVQIDSPMQRKARGTGLGLPLSRRLASLLGGEIRVSSVPGEGSLFELVIPRKLGKRAAADEPAESAPNVAAPRPQDRALVLIVDDDEASRYLLRQALLKLAVEVREAGDGFEALGQAEELVPQAIILDLGMPGLSGFDVLEALRQAPPTRSIPIVIYTSQGPEIESDSRLKDQALTILHKPDGEQGPPLEEIRGALVRAGVLQSGTKRGPT